MNVCIIGDGLTSLSLAKNLINKKIKVDIYCNNKINTLSPTRTIGITQNNLDFFKKEVLKISNKHIWEIKKIEIYTESLKDKKLLNFENTKDNLFYMVKNKDLYNLLNKQLLKNKLFKKKLIKNKNFYERIVKEKKYDLFINCDYNNCLSKKYFSKTIYRDYKNDAFITILKHEKLENKTAIQIFTKFGPVAFLPTSSSTTSVVCSLEVENTKFSEQEVIDLIKANNPKFKIKKILKLNKFKLKAESVRNYYEKNILAFGDLLHKIHPLAGQGFNMTIRDIKILSEIIQKKINLGIQLDSSIFDEFENEAKHKNFIFLNGIDFIYEFFNFEKKTKDKNLSKILRYLSKNKSFNKALIKFADAGLNI